MKVTKSNGVEVFEWQFDSLDVQDVLRTAHQQAISMGANAVSNFTAAEVSRRVGTVLVTGVEITGFAIRRLDP